MAFTSLLRSARAWLGEPDPAKLDALVAKGRDIASDVPDERRADWDRLIDGMAANSSADSPAKMRARVEGLVRACRLFDKQRRAVRAAEKPPKAVDAFGPVDALPGLGPSSKTALAEHGIRTVIDLVWLAPSTWDDMREPMPLRDAVGTARALHEATQGAVKPARVVASAVVKSASIVPIRGRKSVRVVLADPADATCKMHAFWFFFAHGVLAIAKPEMPVLVVGRLKAEGNKAARAAHPELFADSPDTRIVRARYARLGPPEATLRKALQHAIAQGIAPDPVPQAIATREQLPAVDEILRDVHAAGGAPPSDAAKRGFVERLAWVEAFTRVWERIAVEERQGQGGAPKLPRRVDLEEALERELGFRLTKGQRDAIDAVAKDLMEPKPMRRLLLGDVGTGKTAVALAAAAQAIAAGRQVAILAPTSVLAEQYLAAVKPLERAAKARIAFVAAGMPAAARRAAEHALASGEADLAVGTHALLRAELAIPKLALVIVDEQQRLGVAQRLSLVRKGERPHLLTLSATPIPRTLALAIRGELATSTLRERPANRPPVATELASQSDIEALFARVKEASTRGERVFWIVPRVEPDLDDDDDGDPLASAVERRESLAAALSEDVLLLHGGMGAGEKRDVMNAFRKGEAAVLVGTTVVEVGVDVPEATLIVVEDAERFGLAQLHQLRGRVGRGARPGTCVLLHREPLEGLARARLEKLVELEAGEDVARADLELRGAGDLGGTRQHGEGDELLYLADGVNHPWLLRIDDDARAIAKADRALAKPEHRVLASLVARFGHALAVREEAG